MTVLLLLALVSAVYAGSYEDGLAAYFKGDYILAAREFHKAARWGNADAQYNLGLMYNNGKGLPQAFTKAVKWYRKAAEQSHADAQFHLGISYYLGEGIPQNYVRAHMWLNISAIHGKKKSKEARDMVASNMTTAQIAEAQELAWKWFEKHMK